MMAASSDEAGFSNTPGSSKKPGFSKITVALVQDDFPELDRDGNRARVTNAAQEAVDAGCDILALPELWCSGYDLARIREFSDWEREFEFLAELSKSSGLAILGGSLVETVDDKFYNCAVAFDDGKELPRYRKAHLFAQRIPRSSNTSGKLGPASR